MLNKVSSELAKRSQFVVPKNIIDNDEIITRRVETATPDARSSLKLVLSYLFKSNGPTNLRNRQYSTAKPYLTNYENTLACYLKSRTNGNGRRTYGKAGLLAMRRAGYRCEVCKEGDVRLLVLDHANGRDDVETFLFSAPTVTSSSPDYLIGLEKRDPVQLLHLTARRRNRHLWHLTLASPAMKPLP